MIGRYAGFTPALTVSGSAQPNAGRRGFGAAFDRTRLDHYGIDRPGGCVIPPDVWDAAQERRGFGFAINPAVFTSLVDLASTGAQVAGGIALSRDQRLAQQAALESQARLEAARLYAQTAVAQRPSMAWPIAIVAIMAIGAALAAAVLLRRRR